MPLHMRLPKRGFNNIFAKSFTVVSLARIQADIDASKLDAKAIVDAAALVAAGVIRRVKDGVRILSDGRSRRSSPLTLPAPPRPRSRRSKRPAVRSSCRKRQLPSNGN